MGFEIEYSANSMVVYLQFTDHSLGVSITVIITTAHRRRIH